MKSLMLSGFIVLCSISIFSQYEIDQSFTIEEYVNDILLGSGIEASNISFSGDPLQLGFISSDSPINYPLSGGLVLHSGNAEESIIGSFPDPINESIGTDQDLLDIANSVPGLIGQSFTVNSTNDECILEFDFIATGDTVSFNYTFGSMEWTTFINSGFNDVFAFLLSGPGITGPYISPAGFPDGAKNIAGVPDTDPLLPITVSSVHSGNPAGSDCFNCEYYNQNTPFEDININAYTDIFTAVSEVICGETYHIKLAIADGGDHILSSMVVLEEGSFASNSIVQTELSLNFGAISDDVLYEDCGEATLTFTRPVETLLELEEEIFITYTGTAINGVDYTELPASIIFDPFVQEITIPLSAFDDGIDEGDETVIMELFHPAVCEGQGLTTFFDFIIIDEPDPIVVENQEIIFCPGETLEIVPIITGGYGIYDYEWSTTETTPTISVTPVADVSYTLIVGDTCGVADGTGIIDVFGSYEPIIVSIDQGDFLVDCSQANPLSATASGGSANYVNWSWYDQNGYVFWGTDENEFDYWSWNSATEIYIDVVDHCGEIGTSSVNVTYPAFEVEDTQLEVLCLEEFTVEPSIVTGTANSYTWTINGVVDWYVWGNQYTSSTSEDMNISVEVYDGCNQSEIANIDITVISEDIILTMPDPVTGNCIDEFNLTPEISGGSPAYTYQWTDNGSTVGSAFSIDYGSDESTTLNLSVQDICGQTVNGSVDINIINPPINLQALADLESTCLEENEINSQVSGGSGDLNYNWSINGNTIGSGTSITWQSYTTSAIMLTVGDECNESASDDVVVTISNTPLEIETSEDFEICEGDEISIFGNAIGGEGFIFYNWNELSGSQSEYSVSPTESIIYSVIATDQCNQQIQGDIEVYVEQFDLSINNLYLSSSTVQYTSNIFPETQDFGVEYFWDFGDNTVSNEANPIHLYDVNNNLSGSLLIITELGCRDSVNFDFSPPVNVFVPNSFTPDDDGVNDIFKVVGDGIEDFEIFIFNRWGEAVYHSTDIYDGWNGDTHKNSEYYAQNDTYAYLIKLKGYNTEVFEKTGFINLIR